MFKIPILKFFFIATMLSFLLGCNAISEPLLTVNVTVPQYYRSNDGGIYIARYGSLSDGSLEFIKVEMPDGNKYTLPKSISGSGIRYTDNREIVWWEHQQTIRIDKRDINGNWVESYLELKQVGKKD